MEDLKQITKRHQIDEKGNIYKDGKMRGAAVTREDGGRKVHKMVASTRAAICSECGCLLNGLEGKAAQKDPERDCLMCLDCKK